MSEFLEIIRQRSEELNSILSMGLDLDDSHLPKAWDEMSLETYGQRLIRMAHDKVVAIKFNLGFYLDTLIGVREMYSVLWRLVNEAKCFGVPVVLDAKSGDIGSSMSAYGKAAFERNGADALTVNPYLGSAVIKPLLPYLKEGGCVIPIVRTSNPEAAAIQDVELADGTPFFEHIAHQVVDWAEMVRKETESRGTVGAVFGATYPNQLRQCLQILPDDVLTLIPGYGSQGGGAKVAVEGALDSQGRIRGVVNSSRGITKWSWLDRETKEPKEGDPAELISQAIDDTNKELNEALENIRKERLQ